MAIGFDFAFSLLAVEGAGQSPGQQAMAIGFDFTLSLLWPSGCLGGGFVPAILASAYGARSRAGLFCMYRREGQERVRGQAFAR
jgi:hypothetical protein